MASLWCRAHDLASTQNLRRRYSFRHSALEKVERLMYLNSHKLLTMICGLPNEIADF
jgi:hypothetical protein